MLLLTPKKIQLIFFISMTLLALSCKTVVQNQLTIEDINKTASEKLGAGLESVVSPDERYILFVQPTGNSQMKQAIRFVVIQVGTGEIVLEKSFLPGYVKWIGSSTIELLDLPGIIQEHEDLNKYKKTIDVSIQKY